MIPDRLKAEWEKQVNKQEILFLADHGGGYAEALSNPELTPEQSLEILFGLGFRVAERYEMEGCGVGHEDEMWPWARMTNGVAVCLQDGFVVRSHERA